MLENLSGRFAKVLRYLRGEVQVTEENMQQALKDIRMSLLEADVNFKVVKTFIENIRRKAMGSEVLESLNPAQQVIKIVHDELAAMLGSEHRELNRSPLADHHHDGRPAGLGQDHHLRQAGPAPQGRGKAPCSVSLDLKRPAAVEQLERIAREERRARLPERRARPPSGSRA